MNEGQGREGANENGEEEVEGRRGKSNLSGKDVGRKLNVGRALNLSLIMCSLLNQHSP